MSVFVYVFLLSSLLSVLVVGGSHEDSADDSNDRIYYPDEVHHHHHFDHDHGRGLRTNFQHSPEYHKSHGMSEHTVNISESDQDKHISNNVSIEIPVDYIQNINDLDVSELLLNYVDGDVELNQPSFSSRFGDENDGARSKYTDAAKFPKPAGCSPEITTIQLATSNDPSILYIPQCTKVERCSGCCTHSLLACQPTETETIAYQVLKTQYTGAKKLKPLEKEIILIEKHIKCKCSCKVKEEHCNIYQEYRKSECRCACTNTDEEKKCYKNSLKLWNPDLCACQCRDVFDCSTGYSFDNIECRCTPTLSKRASLRRINFSENDGN